MEHASSSRKDVCFSVDPNREDSHEILNSSHEEEPPFLMEFPSPFFDAISVIPTLTYNDTHKNQPSPSNKPLNINAPLPSESKSLKKISVGKKDRHSKIHTAQGLRDRRMRLSLHIARKFFFLQDLLGFDKASKTIEWLFSKSNKAIKEVVENFNSPYSSQSTNEEIQAIVCLLTGCEVGLPDEIKSTTEKPENTEEKTTNKETRKRVHKNSLARETRDQARARARKRTRERTMINEFRKSMYLLGGNPIVETYKLGLGYSGSPPSRYDAMELGYGSGPSEPIQQELSTASREHSSSHHLLSELKMASIDPFENCSWNFAGASTFDIPWINYSPSAGWINSSKGCLDDQGEWDADNFITETGNYGILPSTATLTGDIYDQNPSSFFMSSTTNQLHF